MHKYLFTFHILLIFHVITNMYNLLKTKRKLKLCLEIMSLINLTSLWTGVSTFSLSSALSKIKSRLTWVPASGRHVSARSGAGATTILPLFLFALCFYDPEPTFSCCWFCFWRTIQTRLCSRGDSGSPRFQIVVDSWRCECTAWWSENSALWVVKTALSVWRDIIT